MTGGDDLADRFRGAIVGTAIGDGLGAPFEGALRVGDHEVRRWQDADAPLRWTDDTAMTLGLARSLAAVGGFDGEHLARRFADDYDAEPWRGYGAGPPQIFAALRDGAAWNAPARRMFGGSGSFGNGAAMRAAPVGLWCFRDLGAVDGLARGTARVTHAHELGMQGAVVQAYATGWLVNIVQPPSTGEIDDLLEGLRAVAPDYRESLDTLAGVDDDAEPAAVAGALGNGISAIEAVPAALYAALRHVEEFERAVTLAIRLGGDTDTIAAMTGALVGAFVGLERIPEGWRRRVERHDDLVAVADALLEAALRAGPRGR